MSWLERVRNYLIPRVPLPLGHRETIKRADKLIRRAEVILAEYQRAEPARRK